MCEQTYSCNNKKTQKTEKQKPGLNKELLWSEHPPYRAENRFPTLLLQTPGGITMTRPMGPRLELMGQHITDLSSKIQGRFTLKEISEIQDFFFRITIRILRVL